jgi:hypothetical protein
MRRNFKFIYPLTQTKIDVHRPRGLRYDHVADLLVKGVAFENRASVLEDLTERYDMQIEEILYEGVNILPILESVEAIDKIQDACYHHIHHLFSGLESEYEVPAANDMQPGKVITLPLKRKVNG